MCNRYFIIEIVKPGGESDYTARLTHKIAEGDFEVVAMCDILADADIKLSQFLIANVRKQSGLHYEILPEGVSHHLLAKEINRSTLTDALGCSCGAGWANLEEVI